MKISIPKEAVTQIMADYNCSEKEAARAYLDAQEQAGDAFKSFLEERFHPKKQTHGDFEPKIFAPKEIKRHLDKYVVGQEEYKKRLAIAASYHFAMIKHLRENPDDQTVKRFRKEYGVELILDDDVQTYLEQYAQQNIIHISETLKKFFLGASALNYMDVSGPYKITQEMVQDEKYFDKLFARWYEEQKRRTS
ncbi:MAG: hypothetical protein ACQ9MH_17560 [Nitrospinales bacterium]